MGKIRNPPKNNLKYLLCRRLKFRLFRTVEATIALEEAFGIEIPNEDIEKITDMTELIEYLYRRRYDKNLNSR